MDKLDRFILKYCDKAITTKKSRYYRFGNHTLRVSNHIGANSSGTFSIIQDKKGNYMLHSHSTGLISAISYDQIKDFIKGISIHEDLVTSGDSSGWQLRESEESVLKEKIEQL